MSGENRPVNGKSGPIKVEVLFFAELAEILGPRHWVETNEGSSISAIVTPFFERSPRLDAIRDSLVYAVNERYETSETVLSGGDCLAVLAPMSGG